MFDRVFCKVARVYCTVDEVSAQMAGFSAQLTIGFQHSSKLDKFPCKADIVSRSNNKFFSTQ
jgi:hypothetical protein